MMLVRLTEKGKNEQEPVMPGFIGIFSALSEEEQARFGEYLDRIIAAPESKFGTGGDEMLKRLRAFHSHFGDKIGEPRYEQFAETARKFYCRHHHGHICAGGHHTSVCSEQQPHIPRKVIPTGLKKSRAGIFSWACQLYLHE
ncbi:MAG: hypothetical protein LBU32_26990 [Clostridiales bacterium]|nr:hypothetical protein [Clostridiales bacterium]